MLLCAWCFVVGFSCFLLYCVELLSDVILFSYCCVWGGSTWLLTTILVCGFVGVAFVLGSRLLIVHFRVV